MKAEVFPSAPFVNSAAGREGVILPYLLLVCVPAAVSGWILVNVPSASAPVAAARPVHEAAGVPLALQILAVLVAARVFGTLAQRLGQPRVVGEMAAGIFLGPSLLGRMAPSISATLFPADGLAGLNALSQLGLILFLFVVGLHTDSGELRGRGRSVLLISHASIALPMLLGAGIAVYALAGFVPPGVGLDGFALFIGTAMSITAFPVLARILAEKKLLGSSTAAMATACAAVNDVAGWCLLLLVVARVKGTAPASPWIPLGGSTLFVLVLFGVVRPLLRKLPRPEEAAPERLAALSLGVALASAAVTDWLGLHALFGAFLAGTAIPRVPELTDWIRQRIESLTVILLLPIFFALAGLRTDLGLAWNSGMWGYLILIVATAVAGKLGGTVIAARCAGMDWRRGAMLGALMNTRGLMELVVLNVGLEIGVIPPAIYSMMAIMTLVTTLMTGPLVDWLGRPRAAEGYAAKPRYAPAQ